LIDLEEEKIRRVESESVKVSLHKVTFTPLFNLQSTLLN